MQIKATTRFLLTPIRIKKIKIKIINSGKGVGVKLPYFVHWNVN